MKHIGLTAALAVLIVGMPLLPLLAQDHRHAGNQQPATNQAAMAGMMEKCQEHHAAMSKALVEIGQTIAAVKESTDVGKLQASLGYVEMRVADLREQMNSCGMMKHKRPAPAG